MAYLPPSGSRSRQANSSTPQPHPSLPARPPPTAHPHNGISKTAGAPGSFPFKPRTVTSHPPTVAAAPTPAPGFTNSQANYSGGGYQPGQYQQQPSYYQQLANDGYAQPTPPQIVNPFPLPGQDPAGGFGRGRGQEVYDPEEQAQIAQWQSAYAGKDDASAGKGFGRGGRSEGAASAGGANAIPLGGRPSFTAQLPSIDMDSAVDADTGVASIVADSNNKQMTVVRSGGGKTWQDTSLLEWDPNQPRLFIGNLAGEVTDESLLKAFSKYASVVRARVIRDKRTTKSKGYGFVSFANTDDFFSAAKDMQGKYIGSHPVTISRSTTEIKVTAPIDNKKKYGKHGRGNGGNSGPNGGFRVEKKLQKKDKGGPKLLG
ncbi:hypothetical protein K432DRAFT_379895 [Lepidopterella palustris CBS 459.81]|uniref:RRM domain-containing protein n=1 Tax=Lepidopterella palustris CBS 459.81 TaxID=1314670 RepID=A0A8E2JHM9_9PEZI|nr:hypothetical protein K432DRAFT_379895 [Lepidopterella palustris CBS 459.81]